MARDGEETSKDSRRRRANGLGLSKDRVEPREAVGRYSEELLQRKVSGTWGGRGYPRSEVLSVKR